MGSSYHGSREAPAIAEREVRSGAGYNGQLWLGTRNGFFNGSGQTQQAGFQFGTVSTTTGVYTNVFNVAERPLGDGFGYATIPEPGATALLGLGGLVATRRRGTAGV